MSQKEIAHGDLLYHAVHGLCRVDDVTTENQSGREVLRYSLVPKTANRMKVRFDVSNTDLQASGFHAPVSMKEAREILEYLRAGDPAAATDEDQAWVLARTVLSSSQDAPEFKDARKRQALERSARGLVGELALVLKMTLSDAAASVQKSLGNPAKTSPTVLAALALAGKD